MIRSRKNSSRTMQRASLRVQRAVRVWLARMQRRAPTAWRKPAQQTVELEVVRRRLELLLTALYEQPIAIEGVDAPTRGRFRTLVDRLRGRGQSELIALVGSDENCVRLPAHTLVTAERSNSTPDGDADASARAVEHAIAHLRLLAIAQGARVARRTSTFARDTSSALERDLCLLRESELVDMSLASTVHGSVDALAEARRAALAARPPLHTLSPAMHAVEALVQEALARDVRASRAHDTPVTNDGTEAAYEGRTEPPTAAESLAWARATARRIRSAHPDDVANYRGVRPGAHWGTVRAAEGDGRSEPKITEEAGRRESKGTQGEDGAQDGEPKPSMENEAQESDDAEQDPAQPIAESQETEREPTTPSKSGEITETPPEPEPMGEAGPDALKRGAKGRPASANGIPYPE